MSDAKTRPTAMRPEALLAGIANSVRAADAAVVVDLLRRITEVEPVVWGEVMIGFGTYHYRYASGHAGDWPRIAVAPRKQNLTIHLMDGTANHAALLARLGPHKTGVSCLYLTRLERVDLGVLEMILRASWMEMLHRYPLAG